MITALDNAKRMALTAVYQEARVLRWAGDAIVVGLREDSLNASIAADRDNIASMRAFLADLYGRPIEFTVKTFSDDDASAQSQRSLVEVDAERAAGERAARENEAREHPVTQLVVNTFGAQIKEIKTDV